MEKMKKIRYFIAILCAICSLISYGNLEAYATENNQDAVGVSVYKNAALAGQYSDINQAFDSMTDQTADYEVKLHSDQTIVGHAIWPMVRSIKFSKASEYATNRATLYVVEDTAIQSDVCFSNAVALASVPVQGQRTTKNFYTQNYVFSSIDDAEQMGQGFVIGVSDYATNTAAGLNMIGNTMVFSSDVSMYQSSLYVNYLELADTGETMRGAYSLDISIGSQDSVIDTIRVSTSNQVSIGIADSNLKIGNVTEDTTRLQVYVHASNKVLEIGNVHENCDLLIDYVSEADAASNTVKITGTKQPKTVTIKVSRTSVSEADAPAVYPSAAGGYELLYAPYMEPGRVKFLCQQDIWFYNNSIGFSGDWTYNGSVEHSNGYYYASVPQIDVSNTVLTAEGTLNKEVTYSVDTSKMQLASVKWNWEDGHGLGESEGLTWDNHKLHIAVTGLEAGKWYDIVGCFTYADGSYFKVRIPVIVTAPVENVVLSKQNVVLYYPLQTNNMNIADVTYTADENATVFVTTDNVEVLSNPRIQDGHIYATVQRPGTATLYVYAGDEVLACKVYVNAEVTPTGWRMHEDGNWYYYRDNVLDFTLNGLAYNETEGEWWYAVNGKADFTYTGLTLYGDIWFYVENGVLNWNYTGLVQYGGAWFYVENGVLNWNYVGLVQYGGTWFFVQNGQIGWGYTGLVSYGDAWFYVENGVLNGNYTGLAEYYGGWYYVENGVLNWNYTGLTCYCGTWFYVENGQLNWAYTGLTCYNGGWFYVENGVLNWGYTGLVLYNGTWFYVTGGVLDWGYTGTVYFNGVWWYVENGVLVGAA